MLFSHGLLAGASNCIQISPLPRPLGERRALGKFLEAKGFQDDKRDKLIWTENLTSEFVPEDRTTDTHFQSFPETILIGKSEGIKQRIQLSTESPFSFVPGDYDLEINIESDGVTKPKTVIKSRIRVQSTDVAFFEGSIGPESNPKRIWNRRFLFDYGADTNCYVVRTGKPK